ncbi:hypothetical protein CNBG_0354 [Cryptococcus deuterogattii R265]|uniref:FAD-binding FR-type domain-containing protein n=1 Tax=Cryptococcus deuterogattii (strain R265) TaxID=294750 RepID=A0A095CYX2_CRYD2|nr:hypothetical protein CNBG_0354 [Cryptococcus deuterogattii R265]KIR25624.1 hypothetical protein I309_05563 [Cryptococcus deuterogattii LA55]KIR74362.1 hypothetical protein I310_01969 [Cryptococcus deuterogattii CA1014]KIR94151.1 hypothetical protein I304_01783 [Cryptococcus deuterogattii CBS 10090]KIS01158.1 hypothetical protein L804_01027 [Cryptococcus deuterogattii 2001/935-1]
MACRPSFYAFSRLSFIPKRSFTSAHRPTQTSAPRKRFYALLGLSLSLPAGYYFFQSSPSLSPSVYSDQELKSSKLLTPFHKLVTIKIPSSSHAFFDRPYRLDGEMADVEGGEVVIQHIMVKSPDIQIERPYTLINDPTVANGEREMRMVVKRVRGGEVGRVVHTAKEGETLGVRGPIPTFSIFPQRYDKIIMISTGTAVSPFLQLLAKLSPSSAPRLELIQALPTLSSRTPDLSQVSVNQVAPIEWDWVNTNEDPSFLPSLEKKFGEKLKITRFPQGVIPAGAVQTALEGVNRERVLVLVCLPPWLMRPLCGGMTRNLDQGPVTGLLRELGLGSKQVYKLE